MFAQDRENRTAGLIATLLTAVICAVLIVSVFPISGCKGSGLSDSPYVTQQPGNANDPDTGEQHSSLYSYSYSPITSDDWSSMTASTPVYFSDAESSDGRVTVIKPVFIGENSARLNAAIRTEFYAYAEEASGKVVGPCRVRYELMFAEEAIISCWMIFEQPSGDDYVEIDRKPFNYDVYIGGTIDIYGSLGIRFSPAVSDVLTELIVKDAPSQGYIFLTSPTKVTEDQMFLIVRRNSVDSSGAEVSEYGIILYYRQYELALPSQGCPTIFIGVNELDRLAAANSAVRRLLNSNNG